MREMFAYVPRAALAVVLALAAAQAVAAQQNPTQPGQPAERPGWLDTERGMRERRQAEVERRMREMDLRIVEQEGRRQRANSEERRLDFNPILDDFKLIQVVSGELAQAAAQDAPLDLQMVVRSAADIRKRAGRLSSSLALPKSEKGGRRGGPEVLFDAVELKRSAVTLEELVRGFAHNPVFREVNLLDADLSAKARRDLDEILDLSERMRKSSEQLGKAARRGQ